MTLTSINPSDEQYRWFASAAYRGLPSDIFFVDTGQPAGEAKAICLNCPVQERCLDYAIERNEHFGVWGGFTQRELRLLRREKIRAQQAG